MTEKEKYSQIRREALATGLVLVILIGYWCVAGFGLAGMDVRIAHLPLWVVAGVPGTWLVAIILVKLLLKLVFRDMELGGKEAHHG